MRDLLASLSWLLALSSPMIYIVSIWRRNSRPHRMTRFALCLVLTLTYFSMSATEHNSGALRLAAAFAVQSVVIFGLSLWRHGQGGTSRLDWQCLGIVVLGLTVWLLTGEGFLGMCCAVLADVVAYVPTIRKTWQDPASEVHWTYTLSCLAAFTSLLAFPLDRSSVFQFYILGIGLVMLACIYQERLPALQKFVSRLTPVREDV